MSLIASAKVEQVEKQRRRDVVRQVADHAQRARAGGERREIETQRVRLVDDETLRVLDAAREVRRELAIDLDHMQPIEPLEQRRA